MAACSGARTMQVNCSKITGPETPAGRLVEDLTHNRTAQLVRHMVNGITYEQLHRCPSPNQHQRPGLCDPHNAQ